MFCSGSKSVELSNPAHTNIIAQIFLKIVQQLAADTKTVLKLLFLAYIFLFVKFFHPKSKVPHNG